MQTGEHRKQCLPRNGGHVIVVELAVVDDDLVHVNRTKTLWKKCC